MTIIIIRRAKFAVKNNLIFGALSEDVHGVKDTHQPPKHCNDSWQVKQTPQAETGNQVAQDENFVAEHIVLRKASVIPVKFVQDKRLKSTTKTLQMRNNTTLRLLGSCWIIHLNPKSRKKFSVELLVVDKPLTLFIGRRQFNSWAYLLSTYKTSRSRNHLNGWEQGYKVYRQLKK